MPALLAPYEEKDIFNADETGLFFKCLPDKTLTFKNEACHGGKLSKERVTCLLATNMTGTEKLKVLLIGKSAKPRCFRGVKCLPVTYKNNKKAWMTSELFEWWLMELDKYFLRQNRQVLFIIDNCPAHPQIKHKLKSIRLTFFPPNMTSKLQPLDQGIIKSFKFHYRRRILQKILNNFETYSSIPKIDLLDCVNIAATVWNVDVNQTTILNCFRKAGFGVNRFYDEEDEISLAQLKEKIRCEQQVVSEAEQSFNKYLQFCNINVATSIDDFMNLDEALVTSEIPTDEEIIASVAHQPEEEKSDSDTDEMPREKPSQQDMLTAFETIQIGLTMNENTTDHIFNSLAQIKKFYESECERKQVHQNLITDYFKK